MPPHEPSLPRHCASLLCHFVAFALASLIFRAFWENTPTAAIESPMPTKLGRTPPIFEIAAGGVRTLHWADVEGATNRHKTTRECACIGARAHAH